MKQKSLPIIFFGTDEHSLIALEALFNSQFNIASVITKPDAKSGRGHKITQPPVKKFAISKQIPVWQPSNVDEIAQKIKKIQPVVGVLVAYGKIIPEHIIDLFEPGIINVHPSILPRWRGPSPIEATISHQDKQAGVTIMKLDSQMDSGPIYSQTTIDLRGDETKPELYQTLFKLGSQMLIEDLPKIISGDLQPTDQDDSQATYCQLLSKKDSFIQPEKITASATEAQIRAHLDFPRTRINFKGIDLIITQAHVSDTPEPDSSIKCADGRFLTIDQIIAPSGKTMSFSDFLRGYKPKR